MCDGDERLVIFGVGRWWFRMYRYWVLCRSSTHPGERSYCILHCGEHYHGSLDLWPLTNIYL